MDQEPKPGPEPIPPVPPAGTPSPSTPPLSSGSEVPPPQPPPSGPYYSHDVPPPMPGEPVGPLPSKDERLWATLIHLSGIVGSASFAVGIPCGNLLLPLILWLIKREGAPFINDQGKEAINFQITITIAGIAFFALTFLCIGFPLLVILPIYALVLEIVAAVKANEGVRYRYPLTIRLIT